MVCFLFFSVFTISCYFPLLFSAPLSHLCFPYLFFTIVATSAWGFTLLLKRTWWSLHQLQVCFLSSLLEHDTACLLILEVIWFPHWLLSFVGNNWNLCLLTKFIVRLFYLEDQAWLFFFLISLSLCLPFISLTLSFFLSFRSFSHVTSTLWKITLMTLRHHLHICLHLSCGAVLSLEPFLFLPSPLFYVWHFNYHAANGWTQFYV